MAVTIFEIPDKPACMLSKKEAEAYCRIPITKFPRYHRASGIAVNLEKKPLGTPEFFAECTRLTALHAASNRARAGTLGKLIIEYKKHPAFIDLSQRTKSDYERIFAYLKPIFDTPLHRFTSPLVVKIRDKAVDKIGRKWADYTKTILSLLFAWGKERGFCKDNSAKDIKFLKKPKGTPQANRPWTDGEREAVLNALPPHMVVAFHLMMYCGLDPIDALILSRGAIKNGLIDIHQTKTKEPVWIPLPAPVFKVFEDAPKHSAITVCANSHGKPWTIGGFNTNWHKIKAKLLDEGKVQSGLTLKGLRHTVATILAEMGYDDRTIADMLSQKTLAMAQHYSRRANRARKLTNVVKNFEREVVKRKGKLSNF